MLASKVNPHHPNNMKRQFHVTTGRNRQVERVWIEGSANLPGWRPGDRFDALFHKGGLIYQKNPAGKRKVSGKNGEPVLDTNSKKLATVCGFSTGDRLPVQVSPDHIAIGCPDQLNRWRGITETVDTVTAARNLEKLRAIDPAHAARIEELELQLANLKALRANAPRGWDMAETSTPNG